MNKYSWWLFIVMAVSVSLSAADQAEQKLGSALQEALYSAVAIGNSLTICALLKARANVHDKDSQGRTVFQIATDTKNLHVLPLLKKAAEGHCHEACFFGVY